MRYELLIGLRYLRAKRQEAFISLITIISTVGVVIAVMTLNIVLAVMTGFEEDLRDRLLAFNPQILVLTLTGTVSDYPTVVQRVEQVPGVVAAAPFVYGQVMLSIQQNVTGALVRGVLPRADGVTDLRAPFEAGHRRRPRDAARCPTRRRQRRNGAAAEHHRRQGRRPPARAAGR